MNRIRRFASLFGRRGVLAAAVGALIILGTQVVLQLLTTAVYAGFALTQNGAQNALSQVFPTYLWSLVLGILPFAIGVFLSLWLLAPVAAELHMAHVLTRSVLAAAVGGAVVFVVQLLGALVQGFDGSAGQVFGYAAGLVRSVSSNAGWAFPASLYGGLSTAISLVPLTALAGMLLWGWLRAHPAKHEVVGFIDKV